MVTRKGIPTASLLACYSLRESGDYITLHYITGLSMCTPWCTRTASRRAVAPSRVASGLRQERYFQSVSRPHAELEPGLPLPLLGLALLLPGLPPPLNQVRAASLALFSASHNALPLVAAWTGCEVSTSLDLP